MKLFRFNRLALQACGCLFVFQFLITPTLHQEQGEGLDYDDQEEKVNSSENLNEASIKKSINPSPSKNSNQIETD
jgi:hypothetical protein